MMVFAQMKLLLAHECATGSPSFDSEFRVSYGPPRLWLASSLWPVENLCLNVLCTYWSARVLFSWAETMKVLLFMPTQPWVQATVDADTAQQPRGRRHWMEIPRWRWEEEGGLGRTNGISQDEEGYWNQVLSSAGKLKPIFWLLSFNKVRTLDIFLDQGTSNPRVINIGEMLHYLLFFFSFCDFFFILWNYCILTNSDGVLL